MPDTRGWQAINGFRSDQRSSASSRAEYGGSRAGVDQHRLADSRIAHSGARHLQDTDSGDSKLIFLAPVAGDSWAASARNLLSLASWSASAPRWGRRPEISMPGRKHARSDLAPILPYPACDVVAKRPPAPPPRGRVAAVRKERRGTGRFGPSSAATNVGCPGPAKEIGRPALLPHQGLRTAVGSLSLTSKHRPFKSHSSADFAITRE